MILEIVIENIVKILIKFRYFCWRENIISSPEKISEFIYDTQGSYLSIKELRRGLALKAGADNTCPVTTGIFLRMAINSIKMMKIFYWRVVVKHPVEKLNLDGIK